MIYAVSFSPTQTTRTVVTHIAKTIASRQNLPFTEIDYTRPDIRKKGLSFQPDDTVVFGMPVYAGRIPNLIAKDLSAIIGNGSLCIPVVLFGNRAFDDALIELRDRLMQCGMHPVAAGAFVGQHSFSDTLGAGRPNAYDLALAEDLGSLFLDRIKNISVNAVDVPGNPAPYGGYYQPRKTDGTPIDIRKVKPETNENCCRCGLCADLCPMGSISKSDPHIIEGICIKCGACIKRCPHHAKYISDAGYLAHKADLEISQAEAKPSKIF